MKKLLLLAVLAMTAPAFTGCTSTSNTQVVEYQTLKAVGQSAEATVALAAHLYEAGAITAAQAKTVADFYDNRFQPAFRLASAAVQANLSSYAPQDLLNLASQLSALLLQYRNQTP